MAKSKMSQPVVRRLTARDRFNEPMRISIPRRATGDPVVNRHAPVFQDRRKASDKNRCRETAQEDE